LKFATRDEFWKWLEAEHDKHPDGIWIEIARKSTGIPSVTQEQAVEAALCFGWIDGQRGKKDEDAAPTHFRQRFLPRRKRSKWSKINVARTEKLIAEGLMRPAGLAEIERAKADGRWENAYDPPSKMQVPDDLRAALDASPTAAEAFTKLSSQNRYAILFQLVDAKRPETRVRRIEKFVAMLTRGEALH
jgi:uncharacterized protein YdeI (YjbR/CyaY-like superfamily)